MRIGAYVHLNRVISPSGVGKHILRMIEALHGRERELQLLVSKGQATRIRPETIWSGIQYQTFSLPFSIMQRVWVTLNWPTAERYCGALDWVYCPAESYVPVRCARLAVTVHDVHPFETDLPWSHTRRHLKLRLKWKILFARILKKADLLLTVSAFTKRRLIELLSVDEDRIVVIGNGVEDSYFQPAAPPVLKSICGRPYVLVVGGLTARKGGDIVLKVAKRLIQEAPEMAIVVAGRSEPELYASASGCKNVISIGYADDQSLHSLLAYSVCLLFPSRYEGFGIPVVEAMAAGTPVIMSRQSALVEVGGDSGIVCDTDEQMAAEVCRLYQSPELRARIVNLGRERASHFTWSKCADRLMSTLQGTN